MDIEGFLKYLEGRGYSYNRRYVFRVGIQLIFETFGKFPSKGEFERHLGELYVKDVKKYKQFKGKAYPAYYKYLEYLKHKEIEVNEGEYKDYKQTNKKLKIKMADFLHLDAYEFEKKYGIPYWDVEEKIRKGEFRIC
ncbi:hypothetical protein [Methanocaldococcus sp.]